MGEYAGLAEDRLRGYNRGYMEGMEDGMHGEETMVSLICAVVQDLSAPTNWLMDWYYKGSLDTADS